MFFIVSSLILMILPVKIVQRIISVSETTATATASEHNRYWRVLNIATHSHNSCARSSDDCELLVIWVGMAYLQVR
jgi:hypothetical protein